MCFGTNICEISDQSLQFLSQGTRSDHNNSGKYVSQQRFYHNRIIADNIITKSVFLAFKSYKNNANVASLNRKNYLKL